MSEPEQEQLMCHVTVGEANPVVRQSDLTALRRYVEALDARLTDLERLAKGAARNPHNYKLD